MVYTYRALAFPKSRVAARLVPDFASDLTPEEELAKLRMQDDFFIKRDKGAGRPTKKDRRTIDKIKDN